MTVRQTRSMRTGRLHLWSVLAVSLAVAGVRLPAERPLFTTAFPPEEFAARRAAVLARVGDGVAVLQGATELPSYLRFRQSNHFFYLTGVEAPRALLLLDGRAGTTTLFLQERNDVMERSEGPVLVPGSEAARLTGIADVQPREKFTAAFRRAAMPGRIVYTPLRGESLAGMTPDSVERHELATAADPWDGRPAREAVFADTLRDTAPGIQVQTLDPILDGLRVVKSDREVQAIRESTRIAGLAMLEAMRAARPGMREHEIEAIGDWVFKSHGAQGIAYFALVASGPNAVYPHYHAGSDDLKDGELVLFDYAPDVSHYTSDVTRVFPANGTFSPSQRELYGTYVKLYEALMRRIRPGAAPRDIVRAAVSDMDRVVAAASFGARAHRVAVEAFVDGFRRNTRNSLGHFVGMEVHDVAPDYDVLQPGMVFTIEPQLRVPGEPTYVRLEDVILVTPTGYENLSAFVPIDPEAIERVMTEPSVFDRPSP